MYEYFISLRPLTASTVVRKGWPWHEKIVLPVAQTCSECRAGTGGDSNFDYHGHCKQGSSDWSSPDNASCVFLATNEHNNRCRGGGKQASLGGGCDMFHQRAYGTIYTVVRATRSYCYKAACMCSLLSSWLAVPRSGVKDNDVGKRGCFTPTAAAIMVRDEQCE